MSFNIIYSLIAFYEFKYYVFTISNLLIYKLDRMAASMELSNNLLVPIRNVNTSNYNKEKKGK